jgi:hypothetical protein
MEEPLRQWSGREELRRAPEFITVVELVAAALGRQQVSTSLSLAPSGNPGFIAMRNAAPARFHLHCIGHRGVPASIRCKSYICDQHVRGAAPLRAASPLPA